MVAGRMEGRKEGRMAGRLEGWKDGRKERRKEVAGTCDLTISARALRLLTSTVDLAGGKNLATWTVGVGL